MAPTSVKALIERFRSESREGENWYFALLAAARDWPVAEETIADRRYSYLIAGEALNLTEISERLIESCRDLIPEQEQVDLLFRARPPLELSPEGLKQRLGDEKYKQHLNYFYGITVEEALQEISTEEVRKEERGIRARPDAWVTGEAFLRIYGRSQPELLEQFRSEKDYPTGDEISLTGMKEFTYWLFRYRLVHSDPEKSASDTKKALGWLKKHSR